MNIEILVTVLYRENFLQLDVFYRELSYEEIDQQEAYDIFGLLCMYKINSMSKPNLLHTKVNQNVQGRQNKYHND